MKRRSFLGLMPALAALPVAAAPAAPARWRPFLAGSEAALRREEAGKPFVLAFWSADCPPCRDELPLWTGAQARWPQLRIALVCTDYGDDLARAAGVLAQTGAQGLEHWAFADELAERVRWGVDPGWRGELPMVRFYDGAHRVEVRRGRLDAGELERALRRVNGVRA